MFRNRWLVLTVAIVVIGVVVWFSRRGTGPGSTVDLLPMLAQAEKRSSLPLEEGIKTVSVTINGETKQAILERDFGRIQFPLTVPADAWFSASVAVEPAAWDKGGDGVLFRMGVSANGTYEELLNQHVDPVANSSDRRWIPVAIDLSAYAGRQVRLVLSTNPSVPGKGVDTNNDLGVWGAPSVVVGR